MDNKEFTNKIREDVCSLINKEILFTVKEHKTLDVLCSALTACLIEATVINIKSAGISKSEAQHIIKDALNTFFNDWE